MLGGWLEKRTGKGKTIQKGRQTSKLHVCSSVRDCLLWGRSMRKKYTILLKDVFPTFSLGWIKISLLLNHINVTFNRLILI